MPCFLSLFCSIYYNLKMCVDASAQQSFCSGYKFTVDEIFMEVHKTYFSLCGGNHDPPIHTLLIVSICLNTAWCITQLYV
uniref:Uncharacterized protein n=1 Tax=Cyprinodon variegatus TaxID=28743 RepID=A0A3Q2G6M9_CYPVA